MTGFKDTRVDRQTRPGLGQGGTAQHGMESVSGEYPLKSRKSDVDDPRYGEDIVQWDAETERDDEARYHGDTEEQGDTDQHPLMRLVDLINMPNIATELDDSKLAEIGMKVVREYEIDKNSRAEWEAKMSKAMDLAMQVAEAKTFPWPGAANVKYPLLTTAAIQFAARAYPAIVQGADVVKGKVVGRDPDGSKLDRAERIGQHMSYQLLDEMPEWEEDTDKLLHILPIVGCAFRKTYFDPGLGRNVSELVPAKRLVVNYAAKSLELAPRITHEFDLYPWQIEERMRSGTYLTVDLGLPQGTDGDEDGCHEFLEQHRRLDLDEDGYGEPYCVTVHKDTGKVVRIYARYDAEGVHVDNGTHKVVRVEQVDYFTKYSFIPSPDGGFYDVGFGSLLWDINETINSTMNRLLDAGTLANTGGGLIGSGMKIKGGALRIAPGEWKPVDNKGMSIAENMYQLPVPQPSPVLFELLGFLTDAGREVASVKDVLSGDNMSANMPATTTMAMVEQGLTQFTAIYKRIHRSLASELKKLYRLNRLYLPPEVYFRVLDDEQAVAQTDYEDESVDITPISDPTVITDQQRLAKAQYLMQFMGDPLINQHELRRRVLEAARIENIDVLLPEPQPMQPDPLQEATVALTLAEADKSTAQAVESQAKTVKAIADSINAISAAEAAEPGPQLAEYELELTHLLQRIEAMKNGPQQGSVPGLAPPAGNEGVPPVPDGQAF
jgi:chaperonin GroES